MQTLYDKQLLQQVRRLRLRSRRQTAADLLGGFRSRQKGQGLEYVESRAYEPGDDVRRMDWKVTARTAHPYVKVFHEERRLRVLLLVDVSNSMRFGGFVRTKLQTALSCAMALSFAALRNQDVSQMVLFGHGVERVLPAVVRERDFWAVGQQVEALPLAPYGARRDSSNFADVANFATGLRPRPQLIFVFSDFAPIDRFAGAWMTWPRGAALIPVCLYSRPVAGRLRLSLVDGERGGAADWHSEPPPERVLGQKPVVIDDCEALVPALRRLVLRSQVA